MGTQHLFIWLGEWGALKEKAPEHKRTEKFCLRRTRGIGYMGQQNSRIMEWAKYIVLTQTTNQHFLKPTISIILVIKSKD